MMDEYFAVPISPSNKRAMAQMDALLAREGIERDRNLTYSAAIYDDDGQMIATGSLFENTLRCLAVDGAHRGEGLMAEQAGSVQLRPETVLALVSTIYYSAQWSDQFYEGANTEETFHAPTGDETATFLHSSRSGTVYYGDGFMATELPLRSSGSMWLLKPDVGVTPEDLLQSEDAVGFLLANGSWSQTQQAEVDLSLPKFDVSSDLDLLDALAQLGMTDVQTPGAADFTPLTTANQLPLALTEAKHAARVKIDEDGCEAAAYTILSVCETAAMPPEEIVEFKLDEPFVFAITGADGLPLFAGIVNQVG